MMFCGVDSEDAVLVSTGSAEVASVLMQWLKESARVPEGSVALHADGVTIQLEPKARKALTWFNIRDDGVDKTALSVKNASCLLPYTTPYDVKINLKDKPEDPEVLQEVLSTSGRVIAEGGAIELQLYNHWRDVCSGDSDTYLQALASPQTRNGSVRRVRGCLSSWGISHLPDSVEKLGLALCCPDHAHQVLKALRERPLPNLDTLRVHIRSGTVAPDNLYPLVAPAKEASGQGLLVYISRVLDSDVNWVARVLKALQPSGSAIQSLQLPTCELSVEGYSACLRAMASMGVSVQYSVVVKASRTMMQADVAQLQATTSQYFKGARFMMWDNNDALDF